MKIARFVSLFLLLSSAALAAAEDRPPEERKFAAPVESVKAALKDLGAYSGGRLPTLTGFVAEGRELGEYQRPYYEFKIETVPQGDSTLVRVKAHVSAWYSANATDGMYKEIPSNGRLESDLLDRLKSYLTDHLVTATTDIALLQQHIDSLKQQRAQMQAKLDQLRRQSESLENETPQQAALTFVTPSRTGIPVYANQTASASVLFRTEAEDEFEVQEQQSDWYRVKLNDGSSGWLKRSQLRVVKANLSPPNVPTLDASPFTITREQMFPFAGEWARLKGKNALFVFVQPTSGGNSTSESKMHFAESIFADRFGRLAHSSSSKPYDGIVVIFLDRKGGVAAATIPDIKRWRAGTLSQQAFLAKCSLDPPSAFRPPLGSAASPRQTNTTPARTAKLRSTSNP